MQHTYVPRMKLNGARPIKYQVEPGTGDNSEPNLHQYYSLIIIKYELEDIVRLDRNIVDH